MSNAVNWPDECLAIGGPRLSRAACTIVSPNYLAFARTLAASYIAQHPKQQFFVLLVADLADIAPFRNEVFTPILLHDIGLDDIRVHAMKYDILELNTNVKPSFVKFLLAKYQLEAVVYLDPDIFVYAPLDPVFAALESGATAVLTPHLTHPVDDGRRPSEQDMLYNGTYNLGFIAVGSTPESKKLLDWWERRCLDNGFSEGRTGLFVDQKWMNLAPGLFDGVVTLRDAGCNMAYWNLQERSLSKTSEGYEVRSPVTDRVPLRFFHFSGLALGDSASLSKNTDRYTLADRPDLQSLFAAYQAAVLANKDAVVESLPYGFDTLSDGTAITRLARRIYATQPQRWTNEDPFDATRGFANFAKRMRLVAGKQTATKSTWREFNPNDRRVQLVHRLLKLALRVLGPNRYELLMRYLGYISVLRHQAVFLRDEKD